MKTIFEEEEKAKFSFSFFRRASERRRVAEEVQILQVNNVNDDDDNDDGDDDDDFDDEVDDDNTLS